MPIHPCIGRLKLWPVSAKAIYFMFELEALGQYIPPPRHVYRGCLSCAGDVMTSQLPWRCLLLHALDCSVKQRSRLIPLSVSPNSDESGKQSLYPDGDPDRHQNLPICSLTNCRPSLKISCKSVRKFLSEVANRQKTDNQTDKQTNNDENITSLAG